MFGKTGCKERFYILLISHANPCDIPIFGLSYLMPIGLMSTL